MSVNVPPTSIPTRSRSASPMAADAPTRRRDRPARIQPSRSRGVSCDNSVSNTGLAPMGSPLDEGPFSTRCERRTRRLAPCSPRPDSPCTAACETKRLRAYSSQSTSSSSFPSVTMKRRFIRPGCQNHNGLQGSHTDRRTSFEPRPSEIPAGQHLVRKPVGTNRRQAVREPTRRDPRRYESRPATPTRTQSGSSGVAWTSARVRVACRPRLGRC